MTRASRIPFLVNSDCVIPRCLGRICGGITGAKLVRHLIDLRAVSLRLHSTDLLQCSMNDCHSFRSFLLVSRAEMMRRTVRVGDASDRLDQAAANTAFLMESGNAIERKNPFG